MKLFSGSSGDHPAFLQNEGNGRRSANHQKWAGHSPVIEIIDCKTVGFFLSRARPSRLCRSLRPCVARSPVWGESTPQSLSQFSASLDASQGAHNVERATSMYSRAFLQTSLFLERFWRQFRTSSRSQKPVSKTYRPTNDNFCLLMTLRFPFWYLILRMRPYTWQRFHFRGKKCPKMCQKINRSVKTPWVMGSWPRSSPPFVWLFVRTWIRKNMDCCRSLLKKTAKFLRHETKEGWQRWPGVGEYLSAHHKRL